MAELTTEPQVLKTSMRRDTVLVVDDTPETLGFLTDTLDQAGYTVLIDEKLRACADCVLCTGIDSVVYHLPEANECRCFVNCEDTM